MKIPEREHPCSECPVRKLALQNIAAAEEISTASQSLLLLIMNNKERLDKLEKSDRTTPHTDKLTEYRQSWDKTTANLEATLTENDKTESVARRFIDAADNSCPGQPAPQSGQSAICGLPDPDIIKFLL